MIIAVDFDGVLVYDDFPRVGRPIHAMVDFVKYLVSDGEEVVLWTSRVDGRLDEALDTCRNMGIEFCAVNDNAPSNKAMYEKEYPNGTRKVYADLYIDDHCPFFIEHKSVDDAINAVIKSVQRIRKGCNDAQG